MHRSISVACVAAALVCSAAGGASATGPASGQRAALQGVVDGLVAAGAPGALAVVRTPGGTVRVAAGVASRKPHVPMRAGDRYRIASVTKPFIATLVLELAAQGRLHLDDRVELWLPKLVPNGNAITLRELLNHTSGLADFDTDSAWVKARIARPGRLWTARELVAVATSHPPLFPPGIAWSYSNTNYALLGLVVEAVTGKPLGRVLHDRITGPLGLRGTSLLGPTRTVRGFAHGYVAAQPGLPIPAGQLYDVTAVLAPAGWELASDGDDVDAFFAALLGGRLLRPSMLAAMKSVVVGYDYGLGLKVTYTSCGKAFGHVGDSPGYRNVVYATGDGRRVASVMVDVDETKLPWTKVYAAADAAFCAR